MFLVWMAQPNLNRWRLEWNFRFIYKVACCWCREFKQDVCLRCIRVGSEGEGKINAQDSCCYLGLLSNVLQQQVIKQQNPIRFSYACGFNCQTFTVFAELNIHFALSTVIYWPLCLTSGFMSVSGNWLKSSITPCHQTSERAQTFLLTSVLHFITTLFTLAQMSFFFFIKVVSDACDLYRNLPF